MLPRLRYDAKLTKILRVGSAVFAEKGYNGASIRDISAATGISLSGLYYYFQSKEELLFLIQSHCFDALLRRLDQDLAGVGEPRDRLAVIVRNHLHFFTNNMPEMKVLSHEADALTGEYRSQIAERKRAYVRAVLGCVGTLAPDLEPEDLRVSTFSLFGMMNWIYTWYKPGRDVPVERLSSTVLKIFLQGVGRASASEQRAEPIAPSSGEGASLWTDP